MALTFLKKNTYLFKFLKDMSLTFVPNKHQPLLMRLQSAYSPT